MVALAAVKRGSSKQADVEQRLVGAALPHHERDQRDRGQRTGGEHRARTSSPSTAPR